MMAMKSKLMRRLLILATAFTVLVAGAGSFYVYRKAKVFHQYTQWKAQGLADAAQGKNEEAIDLLARYLQRYPDDIDSLAQFARVRPLVPLPKDQQIPPTIYVLRHLLKLDPSRTVEKRQLLTLYVRTHYWTEADALAGELLPKDGAFKAEDVPAVAARTQAYMAQRNWADALVWAGKWSKLAPGDLQAQIALLELVHQTQNFGAFASLSKNGKVTEAQIADSLAASAQKALSAKGASASDDPTAQIIRGHGQLLAGNRDEALKLFNDAASRKLSDRYAGELLVSEFDNLGRSAEAMPVLRRVARDSGNLAVQNLLARRSWESADWKSVSDLLSKLHAADPKSDSELLALRASALARLGLDSEAAPIRKALAGRQNDSVASAWAFILEDKSQQLLDPARLIALCQPAESGSWYLGFFLGDAQARLGQSDVAVKTLQGAAARNMTWAAPVIRLSQLLLETGHYDAALQAGREAYRRQNSLAALMAMARAWDLCIQNGSAGQADQLLAALTEVQSKVKDDGQIVCVRADVLGATGKSPEAAAVIRAALQPHDKSLSQPSLLQLAAISRKYKLDTEQDCLTRAQADYGTTPQLAYAAATAQFAAGHPAEGLKLLESDRARASDSQSLDWRVTWARYLDLVQDARAKKEMVQLADEQPKTLVVQLQALDARCVRDDRDFMDRTIRRVRDLTGEQGVAWQLARARWLLTFGTSQPDADEATRLLSNVTRLSPDQVEAHALLAACNERAGRLADAITQMRLAAVQSPNSATLGLNLARLLEAHGDFDAARDELTRVRSLPFSDPDQRRRAAVLAAQAGDPRLALLLAQDAAGQSTADANQQLLLAQMYWHSGKAAEAEKICRKLLENPDLAVIQLAADLYASQGRMDDATQVLGRLDSLKLEPGTKELALADFSARHAGPDAALKYLEQATIVGKSNPQVWKAMITYQLAAGQPIEAAAAITRGLENAPADPALRKLHDRASTLTAADTDPGLRPFAVAFARNPDDPAARDILERLVSERAAKVPPGRLADDVKALAEQHPQFLPVWMYLVQCYLNAGRGPGAVDRTSDAMAAALRTAQQFPAAVEPQAAYVGLLRSQRRWQEVLAEAQKWRDRTVANPLAADLQIAEADIQLKRPADALAQLDPYVQNAKAAPRAYDAVLPLYAQARQLAGNTGTAALMEPMLQQGPRGRQAWIGFAINTLEPSEAGAWLDRVEKLIPPDATGERVMLGQAWGVIAQRSQNPDDQAKAIGILKPLADKPDADEPTILAFAMQAEAAANLKEAESYYRRAVKLAPGDIVAKNNLAMVLARTAGDLNEALSLTQAAIQIRSDIPSLYDTLAFVQARMGNFDAAAASARTAIQMQPRDAQYRATLAQVLLDGGRRADASQALRDLDALHLDPKAESPPLRQQIDSIRTALKTAPAQAAAK